MAKRRPAAAKPVDLVGLRQQQQALAEQIALAVAEQSSRIDEAGETITQLVNELGGSEVARHLGDYLRGSGITVSYTGVPSDTVADALIAMAGKDGTLTVDKATATGIAAQSGCAVEDVFATLATERFETTRPEGQKGRWSEYRLAR